MRGLLVSGVSTSNRIRHSCFLGRLFEFRCVKLAENKWFSPSSSVPAVAPSAAFVSEHFPSVIFVFRSVETVYAEDRAVFGYFAVKAAISLFVRLELILTG